MFACAWRSRVSCSGLHTSVPPCAGGPPVQPDLPRGQVSLAGRSLTRSRRRQKRPLLCLGPRSGRAGPGRAACWKLSSCQRQPKCEARARLGGAAPAKGSVLHGARQRGWRSSHRPGWLLFKQCLYDIWPSRLSLCTGNSSVRAADLGSISAWVQQAWSSGGCKRREVKWIAAGKNIPFEMIT